MFRFFVVFFALIVFSSAAPAADHDADCKAKMQAAKDKCMKSLNVTEAEINSLMMIKPTNNLNLTKIQQCTIKCVSEQIGVWQDKKVNVAKITELINKFNYSSPQIKESHLNTLEKCKNVGAQIKDECEAASDAYKCAMNALQQ